MSNEQKERKLSLSVNNEGKWSIGTSDGRFTLVTEDFFIQSYPSLTYPFCLRNENSFLALTRLEAIELTVEWIRFIALRQEEEAITIEVRSAGFSFTLFAEAK